MPRTYDLVMTHQLDADDFFIHQVQRHCAERSLNFFLIEPLWVEAFRAALESGRLRARVLLNMHSEHHLPEDVFHRLVRLAHERSVKVIDPPDVALAAFDKARLHPRLAAAGVPVPATIIVPREHAAQFRLTDADRALLGGPFVVKPSMGYGRKGVLLEATSEADLARSVAAWSNPHYLLQRRIQPRRLGDDPAYFRVFFVFGSIWCCWWNCFTDRYRVLTAAEEATFQLAPLRAITQHIAELTSMNFFSTEIAQTEAGDFVVIDYVNDQCHMVTQSSNPRMGVPDELVGAIAQRLVEGAHDWIRLARRIQ